MVKPIEISAFGELAGGVGKVAHHSLSLLGLAKLMDSNTHRSWAEWVLHPPARGGVSVHLLLSMGKVWPALCVFQKKTSLMVQRLTPGASNPGGPRFDPRLGNYIPHSTAKSSQATTETNKRTKRKWNSPFSHTVFLF